MVKKLLVMTAIAIGVLAMPRPALAFDEADVDPEACATNLLNCYEAAAKIESFWFRWAAGLDCELKFTKCVRVEVIGR